LRSTTNRCSIPARGVGLTLALTITACGHDAGSIDKLDADKLDVDKLDADKLDADRLALRASTVDDHTVTLITGDRVMLRDGAPIVTPGPGRSRIKFSVQTERDHVRVVPDDIAPLIAADQVDLALFDVTLLLASGYGDQRRDDVPLIVTHVPGEAGAARRLATDLIVDRALPALHAVVLRQRKARGGTALASLAALVSPRGPASAASGVPAKIWLDRIHKPLLDHSVPQIGGPAAHARGFTGTGITVAVLDTGVDSTHPDLAGKVIAAEDFTGDGAGVLDVVGHGTHVASIIAGTGAASNGQFAGVAPDAQILSGPGVPGVRLCRVRDPRRHVVGGGRSPRQDRQPQPRRHRHTRDRSTRGCGQPAIRAVRSAVRDRSR